MSITQFNSPPLFKTSNYDYVCKKFIKVVLLYKNNNNNWGTLFYGIENTRRGLEADGPFN